MSLFGAYEAFLGQFLEAGYTFVAMGDRGTAESRTLYLRHDIDFDVDYALRMARAEHAIGVTATYFFMLTSDSYNLLSASNVERVKQIADLGHKISVHYDPLAHEDLVLGLAHEAHLFESAFGQKVDLVSIHRPSPALLAHQGKIGTIAHTYQPQFTQDMFYCADSQGRWRFGSPLESEAFKERKAIHLLVHPIWWIGQGSDPQSLLDGYVDDRIKRFTQHIESNCKTYSSELSRHG